MAATARTGSYVVRSGGRPVPDSSIVSTPRPATWPVKDTRPAAAARTGRPVRAARSTPRWPAAQGVGGGSQPRSTVGLSAPASGATGQARPSRAEAPAAVVDSGAVTGSAAVTDSGAMVDFDAAAGQADSGGSGPSKTMNGKVSRVSSNVGKVGGGRSVARSGARSEARPTVGAAVCGRMETR